MATKDRIRGITIEIDGNTTKLQDALKQVNTQLKNTGTALGDVNRLLKLDPGNTDLLRQKQDLLTNAIEDTRKKLEQEKEALKQASLTAPNYEAWKQANEPIQKAIEETRDKLKGLKKQAEDTAQAMSEGKASQSQYDAIQAEIKETSSQLKDLKEEQTRVRDEFGNPISPESFQNLQREIVDTEQGLQRLTDQYNEFGSVAAQQIAAVGDKMQEVGGKISDAGKAIAPFSAAAAGGLTAAVKVAADFDSAMSQVAAVSGASGEEFDALRDKAREMGAKTKFSASEAAEAMNYMAMAGWKTEDMLNGIEGIMNLAAASGEELATTSDIVTDALTAFGLSAEDSGHFADVLAAASSNANTNVHMMGETFKYVAPVAGALGLSSEDVAEAIGLMANSGIKASQAGTSLRAGLSRLVKPTEDMRSVMMQLGLAVSETYDEIDDEKIQKAAVKVSNATLDVEKAQIAYNEAVEKYDEESTKAQTALINLEKKQNSLEVATIDLAAAQEGESQTVYQGSLILTDAEGNMRTMDEAVNILRDAFAGLSENEQAEAASILFGQEAMSGWLALINAAPEDVEKLSGAIENADGTAQNMADTMQDNLNGQIEILKSQMQELAISIGDILMPIIRDIVGHIQGFVDWLNSLDDKTKKAIVTIGLVVAALAPLLIIIGNTTKAVGNILEYAPKIVSGVNDITGIVGKIGPLLHGTIIPAVLGVLEAVAPFLPWIALAVAAIAGIIVVVKNWGAISEWLKSTWEKVVTWFSELPGKIGGFFSDVFTAVSQWADNVAATVKEKVPAVIESINKWFSELPGKIGYALGSALAAVANWGENTLAWVKTEVPKIIAGVAAFFQELPGKIWESLTRALEKVKAWGADVKERALAAARELVDGVVNWISQLPEKLGKWLSDTLNKIARWKDDLIQAGKDAASNFIKAIMDAIAGLPTKMAQAGRDAVDAMKQSIKEKVSSITSIVGDLTSGIREGYSETRKASASVTTRSFAAGYQTPYILQSPTIFGASGGQLLQGGDGAGAEVVAGMDLLRNMMQSSLREVLATAGAGGQTPPVINLTVDVGGQFFDRRVIQATQNHNFRSGGH